MATRVLVVSAIRRFDVPRAFWIWKALVELPAFCSSTVPVNLLLPLNVCGPVPFSRATFELNAESAT
jgi:hypothetical protein